MNTVFHIGYHKTGTSWLQQVYFATHPHIRLISNSSAPWNDPFLNYLIGTSDRKFDPDECRSIFEDKINSLDKVTDEEVLIVSAERLSGHPFSGGYDSFRIAERIKMCVPNAKILCVVRNQVDIINSVYKQLVAEGYTGDIRSLFDCRPWKSICFDMAFFEYDVLIRKYRDIFGADNVCILPYEDMHKDKKIFLSNLCSFLGVDDVVEISNQYTKIVNKSLSDKGLPVVRFFNKLRKTELNPHPVINIGIYKMLVETLKCVPLPQKKIVLDSNSVSEIVEYYKESNERLLKLVTSDFSSFIKRFNSYSPTIGQ